MDGRNVLTDFPIAVEKQRLHIAGSMICAMPL
jgi:hypothetical protein